MSANPATCGTSLPSYRDRAAARRRYGLLRNAAAALAAAMVVAGMLAIPVYLLLGLRPWDATLVHDGGRLVQLAAGSLRAVACALLVALPLGFASAAFSAHFCAPRLRAWLKPGFELFAAVPTVVLGLVATAALAPWLKQHVATVLALVVVLPCLLLTTGFAFGARVRSTGWLAVSAIPLVLAIIAAAIWSAGRQASALIEPDSPWNAMLVGLALGLAALPLVFTLAEDALALVPAAHARAAFALGATRWQALVTIVLPAAGSGLFAAALLGFSRCFGETMIVLMAGGNAFGAPFDPLAAVRSISAELAISMPDTAPRGSAWSDLLLAALLLLIVTVVVNLVAEVIRGSLRQRLGQTAHA
jgi:phosphate transport system permease protein